MSGHIIMGIPIMNAHYYRCQGWTWVESSGSHFCPVQAGLTHFIKYLVWPKFALDYKCWWHVALIKVWMCCTVTMDAYFLKIGLTDCTIRVFQLFGVWIVYSGRPWKYRAANHFPIVYFKHYFSVITHWGSINTAWKLLQCYPVGATPNLCVWDYICT